MRIGDNPEKHSNQLEIDSYHRVVIPVYIPNLTEDYFRDGLKILKLCLGTLLHTINPKTRISIIDNGCCDEVINYLKEQFAAHKAIDQLLHSKINLGKVNALYSAIKSNLEPIISITDADVMFLPGWQEGVEGVLNDFPEAGMVSPVPTSRGYASIYTYSTAYYGLFKGKLAFSDVADPDGMIKFQESIGRQMYEPIHLEKYLTVANKRSKAVIGCGHFVATFRAEVFEHAPTENCHVKIVGGSENNYLDIPNDKGGFLRLSTLKNYAYHLGNSEEDWMLKKYDEVLAHPKNEHILASLSKPHPISKRGYFVGKVMHKLLFSKFKRSFFKLKGMKQPY
ncbi:glycosyltransferase family A protein [Sungkyunkwania multivorans]|uniref:Glycosyltransferase family A protein n=1 Tax=Sungkyunkwania multivorans TaxID=1173618 RepID=A0ABW3D6C3_9FLAO